MNIWAVGKNYADHVNEMKSEPAKEPMIFLKSSDTMTTTEQITLPTWSSLVHYETEIALLLGDDLTPAAITLALDLTARDAQAEAKKAGTPWTKSKSFTGSCPIGKWVTVPPLFNTDDLSFNLNLNGKIVQVGHGKEMLFKPDQIIAFLKTHFPLKAGDIILTGTPAGVGPLKSGDVLDAGLEHLGSHLLSCHWKVE